MILDDKLARDSDLKPGDRIRRVYTYNEYQGARAGEDYVESLTWEIVRIDEKGPFVMVAPGQGVTPHKHWMPWDQRIIKLRRA